MKILLCTCPDGPLKSTIGPNNVKKPKPLGVMRLLDWMNKKGYSGDIYDIDNERPTDEELILFLKKSKPNIVGLSATFSHCYPNVKRITKIIRELFPHTWIIVGGGLTASSNVILKKTPTDICVVGDGEIPWVKLLDYFKDNLTEKKFDFEKLSEIKGLAFTDQNNNLKVTGNALQIPASDLEYTDYDKLAKALGNKAHFIDALFENIREHDVVIHSSFYEKNIDKKIAYVELSKGCVARCTFCQRSTKGFRSYTLDHLEEHLLELKNNYNVAGIYITDENFGSDKKQSYAFSEIMKKVDMFWIVGAARCTSTTFEDLVFYKNHNMISIRYGIESGSQTILDIMEKKFTTTNVYNAISNCSKAGVHTEPDALMLGMPGETTQTVEESAQFIASLRHVLNLDWNIGSPFWAMAIPGTPLYEYCQQIGVVGKTIDEEDTYLLRVAEEKTSFLNYVNKTNTAINEVHYWNYLFDIAGKKAYAKLIFHSKKSIIYKFKNLYNKCIKGEIKDLFYHFSLMNKGENFYSRGGGFKQKIKWSTLLIIDFLFSIGSIFVPKLILYPVHRVYANIRLIVLIKKHKVKNGKQKYNIFVDQKVDPNNVHKITEERVDESKKRREKSLRTIALDNSKRMRPPLTQEEKALELLVRGQ